MHKAKNKRNVLPKAEVIQLFINNSNLNSKSTSSKPVLPKFSTNDILNHLNTKQSSIETEPQSNTEQLNKSNLKRIFKETKKFNYVNSVLDDNEDGSESFKQSIYKNLAIEFFLDCKQRLDTKSYQILLTLLSQHESHKLIDDDEQKKLLYKIYDLIKLDRNLCNKFSAFLTNENSLELNLIMETSQHEKSYEFFQKLEIMMPNKAALKKLLQSIVALSNFSSEIDTSTSKIEYIKSKIKSVTKNNALINFDLEFLFDQRYANLEPTYEKISIVNQNESNKYFDEEFIDLTNGLSSELSKKCTKNLKNKINKKAPKKVE